MDKDIQQCPTVLIVENHNEVRDLIGSLVQELGWRAIPVEGVAEALDALKQSVIDAIISDWELDDGNGRTVLMAANEQYQRPVPAVVVSSYASEELRRQAREAGAIDLLEKPFRLGQLTNTLCPAMQSTEHTPQEVN